MRTLRSHLFAAILGTVLLTVAASLAIGIKLTHDAARDAAVKELASRADFFAENAASLPPAPPSPQGAAPGNGARGGAGSGTAEPPPPPGGSAPQPAGQAPPVRIVSFEAAARLLPDASMVKLRAGKDADGTSSVDGREMLYSARPLDDAVVIASRPAEVGFSDYEPYFKALIVSSAVAAALAAIAAALLARRLSAPLRRVADASSELAAGRRPAPIAPERTRELAVLTRSFDDMAAQLARAREAERSVLLAVSHELRTPLTAIRGYAEGIEDGTIAPAEAATVVAREAGRLERIVQDLLALARLDQGVLEVRREHVDLAQVAREAESRIRLAAEAANVEIAVAAGGSAHAIADHGRALQVVSNLVENAVRAMPDGGRVDVTAEPGRVTVADTGPGIAPKELPHIFERFHHGRRGDRDSSDGAGLGLAIVLDLTEAMGGTVSVASEPNQGATFTVHLPES